MSILGDREGRGLLEKKGIRISQDKTQRQQNILNHIKVQRCMGFLFRGSIYEKIDGKAVRCTEFDLKPSCGGLPPRQTKSHDRNPKWMGSSGSQRLGVEDDNGGGDYSSSDSDRNANVSREKGRKARKKN